MVYAITVDSSVALLVKGDRAEQCKSITSHVPGFSISISTAEMLPVKAFQIVTTTVCSSAQYC